MQYNIDEKISYINTVEKKSTFIDCLQEKIFRSRREMTVRVPQNTDVPVARVTKC